MSNIDWASYSFSVNFPRIEHSLLFSLTCFDTCPLADTGRWVLIFFYVSYFVFWTNPCNVKLLKKINKLYFMRDKKCIHFGILLTWCKGRKHNFKLNSGPYSDSSRGVVAQSTVHESSSCTSLSFSTPIFFLQCLESDECFIFLLSLNLYLHGWIFVLSFPLVLLFPAMYIFAIHLESLYSIK